MAGLEGRVLGHGKDPPGRGLLHHDRAGVRVGARYDHEQKDKQTIVGTAACGDWDDREPLPADLDRHALADHRRAELAQARQ